MERTAGSRLINFAMHNPLGEEIAEGTLGGLLAGGGMLASDQSIEQTALQTAAAIAGGIGMGMLGRRIGAGIGKRVNPGALKQQDSLLANFGRMAGSETTASGLRDQGVIMKNVVQEGLVKQTSSELMREAIENPVAFANSYGIDPKAFIELAPKVSQGRMVATGLEAVKNLPPDAMKRFVDENPGIQKVLANYENVENLITKKAAGSIDETIVAVADGLENMPKNIDDQEILERLTELNDGRSPAESVRSLLNPTTPVSGEQVGRAFGRVFGDEVGILGGLAAGGVAAEMMGLESQKDRRIRELEEQING
jgi:hypothetical protein